MIAGAGETVTRLRAGTVTDPYSGEPAQDWSAATSIDIADCLVADGGSVEPLQDARNSVESDFDVMAPSGADVTAQDRLIIRGLTCSVVGRPFDWRLGAWRPGVLLHAKIVEG